MVVSSLVGGKHVKFLEFSVNHVIVCLELCFNSVLLIFFLCYFVFFVGDKRSQQ
jgi:hypothetical protein